MTFRDFHILSKFHNEERLDDTKIIYDSMRMQTYFLFSLEVSKKHQKSFSAFCRDYMSFTWDKNLPKHEVKQMTPEDWREKEKAIADREKKATAKIISLEKVEGLAL